MKYNVVIERLCQWSLAYVFALPLVCGASDEYTVTNKVIMTSPVVQPPMSKRTNDLEYAGAIKPFLKEECRSVLWEDVVAWSVLAKNVQEPPLLIQESIVMMAWVDAAHSNHITLACCISYGGVSTRRNWKLIWYPPVEAYEQYDAPVSADQIAAFIKESYFGNNDDDFLGRTEVLKIISYRNDPQVLRALSSGISEIERAKRIRVRLDSHR